MSSMLDGLLLTNPDDVGCCPRIVAVDPGVRSGALVECVANGDKELPRVVAWYAWIKRTHGWTVWRSDAAEPEVRWVLNPNAVVGREEGLIARPYLLVMEGLFQARGNGKASAADIRLLAESVGWIEHDLAAGGAMLSGLVRPLWTEWAGFRSVRSGQGKPGKGELDNRSLARAHWSVDWPAATPERAHALDDEEIPREVRVALADAANMTRWAWGWDRGGRRATSQQRGLEARKAKAAATRAAKAGSGS